MNTLFLFLKNEFLYQTVNQHHEQFAMLYLLLTNGWRSRMNIKLPKLKLTLKIYFGTNLLTTRNFIVSGCHFY